MFPSLLRNLAFGTFGELSIMFLTKLPIMFSINLLYLSLFDGLEVLSSASNQAKLLTDNVSKNSNLDLFTVVSDKIARAFNRSGAT